MIQGLIIFSASWALLALPAELIQESTGQLPVLIMVGLVFAGFAWAATRYHPSVPARVYALFCAGMTLAFSPAPWSGMFWPDVIFGLARSGIIFASIAAALHLVLLIPWGSKKDSPPGTMLVYTPALVCWLLVTGRTQLDISQHPLLNAFLLAVIGLILAAYFITATVAFLRRYIRSDKSQRTSNGTRLMLWCTLAGALPGLLVGFTLLGQVPGARFLMITAVLVPFSWYGVVRVMAESGRAKHGHRRA